MDLFDPLVDPTDFHPNFRSIMSENKAPERATLQKWVEGFPDRDGKFVREFQTSFNSSFWEVYLYALFCEYGFQFRWNNSAPDFDLSLDGQKYVVEATTANHSQGKTAEWESRFTEDELHDMRFAEMNREATIRLSNAFISKANQYKTRYAYLKHVKGQPFVIAIAPFEQPNFNLQYNRPIVSLLYDYYVDEDAYLDNPEKYPDGPPGRSLGYIEKDNGSEIALGFFTEDNFPGISAVIFSCTATWGKVDAMTKNPYVKRQFNTVWGAGINGIPEKRIVDGDNYSERIKDGLQVYHNPYARHPINPDVFRDKGVVQIFGNLQARELFREGVEGSLMFRTVNNLHHKNS